MSSNKLIRNIVLVLSLGLTSAATLDASSEKSFGQFSTIDSISADPITFDADMSYGWIGGSEDGGIDNPSDNIFRVMIDKELPADTRVWLEYEIHGVSSGHSVALIINDNTSIGGYLVSPTDSWVAHREELDRSSIQDGLNRIQFSKLSNLNYKYQVRNLRLVMDAADDRISENIVVSSTYAAEVHKAYVRGFVRNKTRAIDKIMLDNQEIMLQGNSFELLYDCDNCDENAAQLTVIYNDGLEEKQSIQFDKISNEVLAIKTKETAGRSTYNISANTAYEIEQDNFGFSVAADVLSDDLAISLTNLRQVDLPPMSNYLTNVTAAHGGYRLLPHGHHFSEDGATLRIAFDKSKLPRGYTLADIHTFYFDIETSEWQPLSRDSLDLKNGFIYSRVQHFTDYINGVLAAPESPTTSNFTQTAFQDLINADPMAGINLIAPPIASQTGEAALSYPLEVPPGRNGMQPNLALTYNSDAGSSWVGYGWNLNVPSIDVETRWGVPRYLPSGVLPGDDNYRNVESEAYLLSGEQLVMLDASGASYLPHRTDPDNWIPRTQDTYTEFYKRAQSPSGFEDIKRYGGDNPASYYWIVTDRNGVKYYFGTLDGMSQDPSYIISTTNGVAKWLLSKVEDTYGNYMLYNYNEDLNATSAAGVDEEVDIGPGVTAISKFLTSITYAHNDLEAGVGIYQIKFYSDDSREDPKLDARSGVLLLDDRKLLNIDVRTTTKFVRRYELETVNSTFQKTRLTKISCLGSNLMELYHHEFIFYDYDSSYDVKKTWDIQTPPDDVTEGIAEFLIDLLLFPGATDLGSENKYSPLGGSISGGFGASLYLGVGNGFKTNKKGTFGLIAGFQLGGSLGMVELIDINGDGLPDKVFRSLLDNKIRTKLNKSRAVINNNPFEKFDPMNPKFNNYLFGSVIDLDTEANFSKSTYFSSDLSLNAFTVPAGGGGGINFKRSQIKSYFVDINGDGFVDISDNGNVLFNTSDPDLGLLGFDSTSSICQLSSTVCPNLEIFTPDEEEEYAQQSPPLDVVRVWKAPRSGNITISGPPNVPGPSATVDAGSIDGVVLYIQHEGNTPTISNGGMLSTGNINFDPITIADVAEGDRIFFRASSVEDINGNGEGDLVNWYPEIQYDIPMGLDVYGLDSDRYCFSDDMLKTSSNSFVVDETGLFTFDAIINYAAISDRVDLEVWDINNNIQLNNYPIYNRTLSPSTGSATINYSANHIQGQELQFRLTSPSNINWRQLVVLQATIKIDPDPDSNGDDPEEIIKASFTDSDKMMVPIIYAYYEEIDDPNNPSFNTTKWLVDSQIMNYTVSSTIQTTTDFILTIKDNNEVYYQERFEAGITSSTFPIINDNIEMGSNIFCTITSNDLTLNASVVLGTIDIMSSNNRLIKSLTPTFYTYNPNNRITFNAMFRGWGVFAYNPDADPSGIGYGMIPVDIGPPSVLDPNMTPEDISQELAYFPMNLTYSSDYGEYWTACDNSSFITLAHMNPSRLGDDDVNPVFGVPPTGYTGYPGYPIISKGTTNSVYGSVPPFSATLYSEGTTETRLDYRDLNGDRIPDVIDSKKICYTYSDGTYQAQDIIHSDINSGVSRNSHGLGIDDSGKINPGLSVSGNFYVSQDDKGSWGVQSKSPDLGNETAVQSGQIPIQPSFAVASNRSLADVIWMDINGDQLPDILTTENNRVSVKYNLGYGFTLGVDLGPAIDSEISLNESKTNCKGLGVSIADGSFNVGIGYSKTITQGKSSFIDINGDGLIDFVYMGPNGKLSYKQNTGYKFSSSVDDTFFSPLNDVISQKNDINRSRTNGNATNGAYTWPIHLPPPTPAAPTISTIIINPSVSISKSLNRTEAIFQDIDGDGYIDYLESGNDEFFGKFNNDKIKVQRSLIGKTNRIQKVKNSIGGSYNIDYALTPATVQHPGGKFVMSSLSINDGTNDNNEEANDNGPDLAYEFQYANGYHDRCERKFLGFEKVNTIQLNGADTRTTANTYINTNVYQHGLPTSSVILSDVPDPQDNTGVVPNVAAKTITNRYYTHTVIPDMDNNHTMVVDPISTEPTEGNFESNDIIFTGVEFTEISVDMNGGIGETMTFTYDGRGNVLTYNYDNGAGDYDASLLYDQQFLGANLLGLNNRLEIIGLRLRTASYLPTGKIWTSDVSFGNTTATTTYTYDGYGNVLTITLPEDAGGPHMMTFGYEGTAQTFLASVEDNALGYTSSLSNYDYRFGKPETSTDINMNTFSFNYDAFGRLDDFLFNSDGENINGSMNVVSADLSYNVAAFPIWGRTDRYDPEIAGNLLTSVNYTDGLGRHLQSVADAEVNGVPSTVYTGIPKFDAFGRTVSTSYPSEGGPDIFIYDATEEGLRTTQTYDVLDRKLMTTYPSGDDLLSRIGTYTYNGSSASSTSPSAEITHLRTTYTDPNTNSCYTISEYNGPIVESSSNRGFITTFTYDDINQLETVTHPNNLTSTYVYDWVGNLLSMQTPDKNTSFTYDVRSNMISKSEKGGSWITDYDYQFGRLNAITFDNGSEAYQDLNISYTYDDGGGAAQGRIGTMTDITGSQTYSYDALGRTSQIDREIALPFKLNEALTFTTMWEYDLWGRVQQIVYPDGEIVNYGYDEGSTLNDITGTKSGSTYNYVNYINYDEFGARTLLQYGNSKTINYRYRDEERWPESTIVNFPSAGQFEIEYQNYDAIGNVWGLDYTTTGALTGLLGNGSQTYTYDNDYRVESGVGTFTGATFCNGQYTKQFNYTSDYCYDSMGNILEKISTSYRLDEAYKTGYNQNYTLRYNNKNDSCDPDDEESGYLGDNKIHTINEIFSDTDNFYNSVERDVTHTFSFDDNGNTESQLVEGTDIHNGEKDLEIATKRNLIWRQRDNLSVSADNNALTHYFYDGNNDRELKMSDSYNRIFVNGELSADSTKTKLNYSIYVNPYLVLRPDGHYTKHYFIDSERIVSKIGNPDNYMNNFLAAPLPQKGMMEDYIVDNIKKLRGDKNENDIRLDPDNGITIEDESQTDPIDIGLTNGSMATESMQYYFANDHLGSASLITNADGMLIQNLQYTPFGETFVDMRSGDFATPYRFTGKEQDCETGLYYYGARYYDPRLSRFLSVDPLASKFPNESPYNYVSNNPLRYTDPTGMEKDDIIFRSQGKDGSMQELARIETDKFDVTFDIDPALLSDFDLSDVDPVCIDQCEFESGGFDPQAVSFNVSFGGAVKLGGEVELAIIGMVDGPDKGEWGIALQGNGLVGLDGGVTTTIGAYAPMPGNMDLSLGDLRGMEYGVQGDVLYQAGSMFRGTQFTTEFPYMRNTYRGFSLGMAFGPLTAGGSGYFGISDFIYRSDR